MDNESNHNEVSEIVAPPVVPDTTAPVQSEFATPPQKRRSPKLLIGGIIAAALIVLGGGSALAYTMWYQNSDKVVHDAILNAIQAKAVSSTGTAIYKSGDITMDITLDGKSSEGNGEFTVKAKVAINTAEMKQDFDASGTGKIVGDTLYVKVSGVKSVVEDVAKQSNGQIPSYATSIFDKIEDKWISIKTSDYQDINEDISRQQTCLMDLVKKMQSDKSMTHEVAKLYRDNQIVTIKEELGAKTINGVGSLGYAVDIDKDATAAFTKGLSGTTLGKEIKNCSEDVNFNKIAEDITGETTDSENAPTVELWVSRFGHKITEVSLRGNSTDNDALTIVLQPTFNKTVTVEAPSDTTSLKTVLEEIQSAMMEYYMQMYSTDSTTSAAKSRGLDFLQPAV